MNRPMPSVPVRGGLPRLNPMMMLQQLQQNPMQVLRDLGLDIPMNMNDPNAIIQHLMNSGQVSQQRYEQARQLAARFKR